MMFKGMIVYYFFYVIYKVRLGEIIFVYVVVGGVGLLLC